MPKHPTKANTPQMPADEELETIRVNPKRPAEVAPVEGPSASAKAKRASGRKKVKVEVSVLS